jgi:hypothetical protein
MEFTLIFNRLINLTFMKALRSILLLSVLFIQVNSAYGNTPQAVSDKDSMMVIFKGPTLQEANSLRMNNYGTVVSNETGKSEVEQSLIDHFKTAETMENLNSRWFDLNRIFAINNATIPQQSAGIINVYRYYITPRSRMNVSTSGVKE